MYVCYCNYVCICTFVNTLTLLLGSYDIVNKVAIELLCIKEVYS